MRLATGNIRNWAMHAAAREFVPELDATLSPPVQCSFSAKARSSNLATSLFRAVRTMIITRRELISPDATNSLRPSWLTGDFKRNIDGWPQAISHRFSVLYFTHRPEAKSASCSGQRDRLVTDMRWRCLLFLELEAILSLPVQRAGMPTQSSNGTRLALRTTSITRRVLVSPDNAYQLRSLYLTGDFGSANKLAVSTQPSTTPQIYLASSWIGNSCDCDALLSTSLQSFARSSIKISTPFTTKC